MNKKEQRIMEIMNELGCDMDAAESMFDDEIKEKYHTEDLDVAESMFFTDCADDLDVAEQEREESMKKPVKSHVGYEAETFIPLLGFTLVDVTDGKVKDKETGEETDVLMFQFENQHGVSIHMDYMDTQLYISEPYASLKR